MTLKDKYLIFMTAVGILSLDSKLKVEVDKKYLHLFEEKVLSVGLGHDCIFFIKNILIFFIFVLTNNIESKES